MAPAVETLYKAYKDNDKVAMFFVYINEAHPSRSRRDAPPAAGAKGHAGIGVHKTMDDRVLAASKCMEGLKLTLPMLIDTMDGVAEKAYKGRPAATVVVDLDGKVALHTRGPSGVQPTKADKALKELIGRGGLVGGEPRSWPTTQPAKKPAK